MGNYLLCSHPLAGKPFYIESIHLNIYSIEELCFFLSTNMAIADEVILNPLLAEWLSEQCGIKNIKEYNSIVVSDEKIGHRLYWIFVKSHYFAENELRKYKVRIDAFDNTGRMERQKLKGDALLKFGKYKRSIGCYEEVFAMQGISSKPSFFRATVWHNMGCAYEKLFQTARAVKCFEKAFEIDGSDIFRDSYIKAVYFDSGEKKAEEEIKKLELDDNYLHELKRQISEIKAKPVTGDIQKTLNEWVKQYHLSVDQ
jgi:tetratricopeptide (TPR) repeat protein